MIWTHHGDGMFDSLVRFVSSRVWGEERDMGPGTGLGIFDKGALIGAAIFHNYQSDAGVIEISAAADSPRWLSRNVLQEMFGYAFEECGCQAVVLRCEASDRKMDRIARAYGFQRFEIPRLRGRDRAEAIFVLGDDVWRQNGFHKEKQHG